MSSAVESQRWARPPPATTCLEDGTAQPRWARACLILASLSKATLVRGLSTCTTSLVSPAVSRGVRAVSPRPSRSPRNPSAPTKTLSLRAIRCAPTKRRKGRRESLSKAPLQHHAWYGQGLRLAGLPGKMLLASYPCPVAIPLFSRADVSNGVAPKSDGGRGAAPSPPLGRVRNPTEPRSHIRTHTVSSLRVARAGPSALPPRRAHRLRRLVFTAQYSAARPWQARLADCSVRRDQRGIIITRYPT